VAASAAVAVLPSTAALLIFFGWGLRKRRELHLSVAAATAMCLADHGIHYTAMAGPFCPRGLGCA